MSRLREIALAVLPGESFITETARNIREEIFKKAAANAGALGLCGIEIGMENLDSNYLETVQGNLCLCPANGASETTSSSHCTTADMQTFTTTPPYEVKR